MSHLHLAKDCKVLLGLVFGFLWGKCSHFCQHQLSKPESGPLCQAELTNGSTASVTYNPFSLSPFA